MKTRNVLVVSMILLLTTGCGTVVKKYDPNPEAFTLGEEQIPDIKRASTVSLINEQTSEEEVLLGEHGRVDWKGNLRAWTDAAINQAARRLAPTKIALADNGKKTLKLAITKAELVHGFVMTRSIVNLRVKTGDGKEFNFTGDHRATAGVVYLPKVAMDGAVSNAAISMVNDPEIIEYLSK